MFKNITALRINGPESQALLNSALLLEAIQENPSEPPAATLWTRLGFAHPTCFGEEPLFEGAMGARVFVVRLQERLLPGKVIKQHVNAKRADLEEKENRKLNRKELAQIKDAIVAEMLPKAFIKASDTLVMVYKSWLIIDTGSAKVCDEITCFLRDCLAAADVEEEFELLSLRPIKSNININEWLADIVVNDDVPHFEALDSAVFKGNSKSGGTIRFKDIELSDKRVLDVIAEGKRLVEMSMSWSRESGESSDMHFSINDQLVMKRVKFADLLIKQAADDAGEDANEVTHFDATTAILADLIVSVVCDIEKAVNKPEEDDEL